MMVEGCDYSVSGEQWVEHICYIYELKNDWERDKEELGKYREFLSKTEERLSKKSRRRSTGAGTVSKEQEWQDEMCRELDPRAVPRNMCQLQRSNLKRYLRAAAGYKLSESARQRAMEVRLDTFRKEMISKAYGKEASLCMYRELCTEIMPAVRAQQPVCRTQADLLRLRRA